MEKQEAFSCVCAGLAGVVRAMLAKGETGRYRLNPICCTPVMEAQIKRGEPVFCS